MRDHLTFTVSVGIDRDTAIKHLFLAPPSIMTIYTPILIAVQKAGLGYAAVLSEVSV